MWFGKYGAGAKDTRKSALRERPKQSLKKTNNSYEWQNYKKVLQWCAICKLIPQPLQQQLNQLFKNASIRSRRFWTMLAKSLKLIAQSQLNFLSTKSFQPRCNKRYKSLIIIKQQLAGVRLPY